MAGSVAQVYNELGIIKKAVITCIGDAANGTVPATALTTKIGGLLLALETNPGATAPDANYDITLIDGDGHDVLEGVGMNRHNSNTEKAVIVYSGTSIHPVVDETDTLTLTIAQQTAVSAIMVISLYYTEGT